MVTTAWPTETLLLVLFALVVVLGLAGYISSKFGKVILRKMPEPRDLPQEVQHLREVAAREYAKPAIRMVKQ